MGYKFMHTYNAFLTLTGTFSVKFNNNFVFKNLEDLMKFC